MYIEIIVQDVETVMYDQGGYENEPTHLQSHQRLLVE